MKVKNDIKRNNEYQNLFYELDGSSIPRISDSLDVQNKIEQLIFYYFAKGVEIGNKKSKRRINELNHRCKVQSERIRGLEIMLKEAQRKNV